MLNKSKKYNVNIKINGNDFVEMWIWNTRTKEELEPVLSVSITSYFATKWFSKESIEWLKYFIDNVLFSVSEIYKDIISTMPKEHLDKALETVQVKVTDMIEDISEELDKTNSVKDLFKDS